MSIEQAKAACARVMKLSIGRVGDRYRSGITTINDGQVDVADVYATKNLTPLEMGKLLAAAPEMLQFISDFIIEYNKATIDLDPLYNQAALLFDKATK